jgi:hypothetical protein
VIRSSASSRLSGTGGDPQHARHLAPCAGGRPARAGRDADGHRSRSKRPRRDGRSVVVPSPAGPGGTPGTGGSVPAATAPARRRAPRAPGRSGCAPARDRRPAAERQHPGSSRSTCSERARRPAAQSREADHDEQPRGRGVHPRAPGSPRAGEHRHGAHGGDARPRRHRSGRAASPRPRSSGVGTEARIPSSTASAVAPSSSTSGRSWTRWRSAGLATAFTSSGVTNGARPATPTPWPRAAASSRPRATPQRHRRRLPGRPGERDDVAEHRRVDPDRGRRRGPRPGRPRWPRARTPAREVVRVEAGWWRASMSLLLLGRGVGDQQLEQEPVELRLGQRVGALVLDRVLGGDHDERVGQRPGGALDGDLPLLHRLEQRGLGLGRRAVDLVGEQQVGEHRPLPEAEGPAVLAEIELAGHVGRHQVGRELHPLELEVERAASVLTSSVLATPGTPSSSTWPRTSSAATGPTGCRPTTTSWPTTTLATSIWWLRRAATSRDRPPRVPRPPPPSRAARCAAGRAAGRPAPGPAGWVGVRAPGR